MKKITQPVLQPSEFGNVGRSDPLVPRKHEWRRVPYALLLTVAVVLIVSSDTLHGLLLDLLDQTDRLIEGHPRSGALLFMGLAGLSAMLAFFSSVVIVPVGVSAWGTVVCVLLLWGGWVLGGAATYLVGRTLGRRIAAVLISRASIARYENRITEQTPFWLVFLFQAAMPSEVPGYVLGMARYPFWKYLVVVLMIELPWAVGTVFLSEGLLERRLMLIVGLSLAGIAVMALALFLLHMRPFGARRAIAPQNRG